MQALHNESETREALILAGIAEIDRSGLRNFSMRRIASACGVSCAAPYKHFENRADFILAILQYINSRWNAVQEEILSRGIDTRALLVEISVAYVRFLVEHPYFRSMIMLRDDTMSEEMLREKGALSACSRMLIHRYCQAVRMDAATEKRKTYVVRSLIYGAALMIDNGELPGDEESYAIVREAVEREFDLQ